MIFRESSKGTVKSINITKSSIEESTVYQYITLPVSGNYTVTAHDIVDGTIITNPSVVYPQVLEYILLLPSPTETTILIGKYHKGNDFVGIKLAFIFMIFCARGGVFLFHEVKNLLTSSKSPIFLKVDMNEI